MALNQTDGEEVWKTEPAGRDRDGGGYSSPVKTVIGNVPMYVVLLGKSGGLVGVHAETGKLLWQYKGTAHRRRGTDSDPRREGRPGLGVVQLWRRGGPAPDRSRADGTLRGEGTEDVYEADLNNHHGGMVLVGDYIYFGHDQNGGKPGLRGLQDRRDQVGAGETSRRPAASGRRRCCTPTGGCTSGTRTACWC